MSSIIGNWLDSIQSRSTWTKISKLHDGYKDQQKKRNMTNKKSVEGRKRYEENLNKLFDISHPDLEKNLAEDRIRREGGRMSEDLQFLEDQRGPRKMKMGNLDEEFQKRKTAQLKRKLGQVPSSTVTSTQLPNILSEDQMNEYL